MHKRSYEQIRTIILKRTMNQPNLRKKIARDAMLNRANGQAPIVALKRAAVKSGIEIW